MSAKLLKIRDRDIQLKGGVFAGQGGFGCAYSPPLLSDDPSKLGKIMLGEQLANNEYLSYEIVKKIDPEGKFGVYATDFKEISEPQEKRDDLVRTAGGWEELQKCYALKDTLVNLKDAKKPVQSLWQITMPKAAGDVYKLLLPFNNQPCSVSRLVFHMKALRNLYLGLNQMHAAKVCHLDIKEPNTVVFGTVEDPIKYKYIDFGLAMTYSELAVYKATQSRHHLSRKYSYYPIVTNMAWTPYENEWVDYFTFPLDAEIDNFVSQDDTYPRLKITRSSIIQDHQNVMKTYGSNPNLVYNRVATAIAADVFGLAHVTAWVYRMLAHVVFDEEDITMTFTPKKTTHHAIDELRPVSNVLADLLSDMMHMRVTAGSELLERYDAVVSMLEEFVAREEMQRVAAARSIFAAVSPKPPPLLIKATPDVLLKVATQKDDKPPPVLDSPVRDFYAAIQMLREPPQQIADVAAVRAAAAQERAAAARERAEAVRADAIRSAQEELDKLTTRRAKAQNTFALESKKRKADWQ